MNTETRALLRSTWLHSPWGWMVLALGLGLGILGVGALVKGQADLAQNVSLWLLMWMLWLSWLLMLVGLLGSAGLQHYGLAQQLRLPRMASSAVRLTTAGMLLVFAMAALGMMQEVHPGHHRWAWPWACCGGPPSRRGPRRHRPCASACTRTSRKSSWTAPARPAFSVT